MIKIRCKNCIASPSGDMHEADPKEVLEALDRQAPEVLTEWATLNTGKILRELVTDVHKHVRPWGYFEVLAEGPGYKVKRLVIEPGKRTSLQWHEKRWEFWTVASGHLWSFETGITPDQDPYVQDIVPMGNEICEYIQPRQLHRICNDGERDLVIIEVQTFDSVDLSGEDDVHRIEDDYDRAEGGES